MFTSIVLIIAGILACYGLIVANAPSIKDELDAIIPFQGIVGILLLLFGLWDIFFFGRTLTVLEANMFFGILAILSLFVKLLLGFVLAYGLLTKYVLTAPTTAKEQAKAVYKQLVFIQMPIGILAILIGLTGVIFNILY